MTNSARPVGMSSGTSIRIAALPLESASTLSNRYGSCAARSAGTNDTEMFSCGGGVPACPVSWHSVHRNSPLAKILPPGSAVGVSRVHRGPEQPPTDDVPPQAEIANAMTASPTASRFIPGPYGKNRTERPEHRSAWLQPRRRYAAPATSVSVLPRHGGRSTSATSGISDNGDEDHGE
jgi:hypothetical protein